VIASSNRKKKRESMSDPNDSTSIDDDDFLSPNYLEFCAKVLNNDPSILPEPGEPLRICRLNEKEDIELAAALLENNNVTYLQLDTAKHTKTSAWAMAKYMRTSKHLQRIDWYGQSMTNDRVLQQREEMLRCFLAAYQESTSLKELDMEFLRIGERSNLALESMLTHTQTLRSLSLICPVGPLEDIAVSAASSGLKKNNTLRELTLVDSRDATTLSPILTSLHDHPCLRRLCLRGDVVDLTGLDTVLLSDTSQITQLDIERSWHGPPMMGLTHVLRALARCPTLTKLGLRDFALGREGVNLLRLALYSTTNLQSLDLPNSLL
jgi:hypothetical protein